MHTNKGGIEGGLGGLQPPQMVQGRDICMRLEAGPEVEKKEEKKRKRKRESKECRERE